MKTVLKEFEDRYDHITYCLHNMFEYDEQELFDKKLRINADIIRSALNGDRQDVDSGVLDAAYQRIGEIESAIEERHERLGEGLEENCAYFFLVEDKQQEEKPWLIGYVERCAGCTKSWYYSWFIPGIPAQFKDRELALEILGSLKGEGAVILSEVCSANGPVKIIEKTDFVRQCLAKHKVKVRRIVGGHK